MTLRDYYRKVTKYGRMLGFQNNVVENQFLRGLSPDNMLEVDRIGANRPLGEIVDALKKAEMRLGLTNRSTQQEIILKTIALFNSILCLFLFRLVKIFTEF